MKIIQDWKNYFNRTELSFFKTSIYKMEISMSTDVAIFYDFMDR